MALVAAFRKALLQLLQLFAQVANLLLQVAFLFQKVDMHLLPLNELLLQANGFLLQTGRGTEDEAMFLTGLSCLQLHLCLAMTILMEQFDHYGIQHHTSPTFLGFLVPLLRTCLPVYA